eukprot:223949_1
MFLEGTLGQVVSEGTHHDLGQGVHDDTVQAGPGLLDEVTGLGQARVDGTDGVEHLDDAGDLAGVRGLLLEDSPDVLTVRLLELAHGGDDGVGHLTVTDVLTHLLEVALEAAQVQGIVDDLEGQTDLGAVVLKGVGLLLGGASDDTGHAAQSTGGTTGLVGVDGTQGVEDSLGLTGGDDVGHHVVKAVDVQTLASVAGAEHVEVELVDLEGLGIGEVVDAGQDGGHEVARGTGVDGGSVTVLQVDTLAATADVGLVLDIIDDQRTNVEELGDGDVLGAVNVLLGDGVHGADQDQATPGLATAIGEGTDGLEDGVADDLGVDTLEGALATEAVLVDPVDVGVQRVHVLQGALHVLTHVLEHTGSVLVLHEVLALKEADTADGLTLVGTLGVHATLVETGAGDEDGGELLVLEGGGDVELQVDGGDDELPLGGVLNVGVHGGPVVLVGELELGEDLAVTLGVGENGDLLLLLLGVAVDDVEEGELVVVSQLDGEPGPGVQSVAASGVIGASELAVIPAGALDLVLDALDVDGTGDGHLGDVVVVHIVDDTVLTVDLDLGLGDEGQLGGAVAEGVVGGHLVDGLGGAGHLLLSGGGGTAGDGALVVVVDVQLVGSDGGGLLHAAVGAGQLALLGQSQEGALSVLGLLAGELGVQALDEDLGGAVVQQGVGVVGLVLGVHQGPGAGIDELGLAGLVLLLSVELTEEGGEDGELLTGLLGSQVGVVVPPLELALGLGQVVLGEVDVLTLGRVVGLVVVLGGSGRGGGLQDGGLALLSIAVTLRHSVLACCFERF